ncbi:alpha/beta hydrolase [Rhodococcoides kyotonense]|uniref:Alpha/beta hydrolase n=1 Tax=Rhodococcoides kyotonense TaxID=398843 RepID=A0A177YAP7_9NOCA|nr:alpha/beta fold hydrolase [Rhodococcus kyotonensis]OAK52602.1 alpha/beta hydrolase [Rhodococcus kyotonensis]
MPFFEGVTGAVHYRSWTTAHPRLVLVFLHGLGQNSGHYHRLARVLNGENIDVWAVDHVGHGLTEGELSDASQIGGLADNALQLAEIARSERAGVPMALMGHSLGAATTIAALHKDPDHFVSAVLCGTPTSTTGKAGDLNSSTVPLLAMHGVDDRMAPIDAVREWIPSVPGARLREFENAGHDLLHEKVHRTVTLEAADFLLSHV